MHEWLDSTWGNVGSVLRSLVLTALGTHPRVPWPCALTGLICRKGGIVFFFLSFRLLSLYTRGVQMLAVCMPFRGGGVVITSHILCEMCVCARATGEGGEVWRTCPSCLPAYVPCRHVGGVVRCIAF